MLTVSTLVLSLGFATAHAQTTLPEQTVENRGNLWFVELTGAPTASGNSLSNVRAAKTAFRRDAAAAGIKYTERRSFDVLFNGFSVEASAGERRRIAALPGVKALYPVEVIQAPSPEMLGGGSSQDMATAIAMTGANLSQASGWNGTGVKVAVMDTGIDIDHPDFGGSGVNGTTPFPTARITHGWDFVGDAFNADPSSASYDPTPMPDANPDDCGGHGTHVAGIIGANGTVKGVAPGVTFGAYRVFGCNGSTTADIMIAAMERALADGMHVLNMSIGSSFQWPQYPTAQAADRLVDRGMVVVASIGNSGTSGLFAAGAPGLGQKVIGTASFDNTAVTLSQFTVSPDARAIGYSAMTGSVAAPTAGSLPMARTGTTSSTADACSPLPANSLKDKAALIRRGTCGFAVKAANAQAAGAKAVVIYNNSAGRFSGTIAGSGVTIPTVQISDTEGALINTRLASGAVTMTWKTGVASFPNATGNLISSFSSYGLAPDLSVKPDVGAPGGLIYSTYPLEQGGFATLSGTSMASPHVAGVAAQVLQAQPGTLASAMRTLLQNSADPKPWWGSPGAGYLDNVHRQGAGMVDSPGAVGARVKVEPSSLALGESASGTQTRRLTLENSGRSSVTYNLSYVNALSTGANTFTPSFHLSNATVAFSLPSVTVPAGSRRSAVDVTVTPASAPTGGQYGGYIVLTDAADPTKVLRVPFAGYIGDYQARQVLVPTPIGFPLVGIATSCVRVIDFECINGNFALPPSSYPYTMTDIFNAPSILFHLDHHAQRLRLEAFDAVTGKAWNLLADDQYWPRNSTSTGFFAYSWDGTTFSGMGKSGSQRQPVPNGRYIVRLSVLKALGDESNPAHWETWSSPAITIARP
jgi:subtilisin family serine protease